MAIKKLQPGYRVRITAFVPYDPSDTKSVRAALDFADGLKTLPATAPKGATIESFSFQSGRADTESGQI